jgi:beta-glucanase (GH16 family)
MADHKETYPDMRSVRIVRILLLALMTLLTAANARGAAPVGQTVWLKAAATGGFVSADTNRGAFAPLVADRTSVGTLEQFQVVDGGGGFIALRSVGTGRFVSADLNRGTFAPLVADRTAIGGWERFQWVELAGGSIALRGSTTNRYVAADLARGAFAPLVSDRTAVSTWETFTWAGIGTPPPTWRLVWSDEFNGTTIDRTKWTFEQGGGGWGNAELQNYTDRTENARIENGHLVIEARRENFGGNAYTSARMKTQGLASWTRGRMEARIDLPATKGMWPAFWMLGNNISSVGWPACGEIDIMEMAGGGTRENTILGTIHWDFNGHASFGGSTTGTHWPDTYHIYAIEWEQSEIRWYVDGVQYVAANITINNTEEFSRPMFLLLNLAVGGTFPGNPDATTVLPQRMLVDYVRVYQR